MTEAYVLYDYDQKAAYDVDVWSHDAVVLENARLAACGHSTRWITMSSFRSLRSKLVVGIITKSGEFTMTSTFRSREHAEETARSLGGVVKEMAIF